MVSESIFRTAVFDALCACLGLDRNGQEAAALIREAYAEPENTPRLPRNRDVVYWTVLGDPSAEVRPAESVSVRAGTGRNTHVVYTTLNYRLIIVCYGPSSETFARRIRSALFLDGPGCPRRILRAAGIFPVPDPPQPVLLYEEEGSLWRRRADLTVSLRVADVQAGPETGSVSSAPQAILWT